MSYKSVKDVVTMLLENGFVLKSQKGSHMKFEKDGMIVIVPDHNSKGVEKGTYLFHTLFTSTNIDFSFSAPSQ